MRRRDLRKLEKGVKKINKRRVLKFFLLALFLLIIISCVAYIAKWYIDVRENKNITEFLEKEIEKNIVKKEDGETKINLSEFKNINSDTKGVLEIKAVNFKNIIVQAKNNDYYLNHDFYKKFNMAGWFFADYRSDIGSEFTNMVIYGHNMRISKTMFWPLSQMMNAEYFKNLKNSNLDNEKFEIKFTTDSGEKKYRIFAAFIKEDENIDLDILFPKNKESFENSVKNLKKQSFYDFKEPIGNAKQMITIMTCAKTNHQRFILSAIRIK